MAAVLKKRALAEFSSQTQVISQDIPKPKKLRLVKKLDTGSSATLYIGLLESSKSSNEASQTLLRILEAYDTLKFEGVDLAEILKKLTEHYHQEKEAIVRVNLFELFGRIGREPGVDIPSIVDDIMQLLKKEESHLAIAEGLSTLLRLGQLMPDNVHLHEKLTEVAKECLTHKNHLVKCACLNLLGGLVSVGTTFDITNQSTLRLVGDHAHSEDARVRSAAFRTMINLHNRGLKLDPAAYSQVCLALKDDYEVVRRVALQVIWVLAQAYPENVITLVNGETIRLVDDAFAKLCNSVNDLSLHVRRFAVQLLGTMTQVSARFLEQTLNKTIMSNMRKKRSAHERAWESMTSGEWSSGKAWADDAPREIVDGDTFDLLSSGACGAFVHGLEDEYQEVRSASVDSLCALALMNPEFAHSSLDFLVDMFNDEIEDVRLKAIDSLTKISKYTILREDQLEIILGALKDFSMDVREGLHRMLAACRLSTKGCLQMCVDNLLENLKKYPTDRKSTWQCLQRVGQLHPELTLPLVPELLAVHPFFDTPEPDVEDPAYICILILVFNAAQHCPSMMQLFEEHTLKHYVYLRDTMPNLVPVLKLGGTLRTSKLTPEQTGTAQFLDSMIAKIESTTNPRVREKLLELAEKNLTCLAEIDGEVSGSAQFLALFIGSQLLFAKVLANRLWSNPQAMATQQCNIMKTSVSQLLQHSLKLQHVFVGLREEDLAAVKQFKLKVLALQLVYVVRGSNTSALALCEHFLEQVEDTQRYLSEQLIQPEAFTLSLFKEMSILEETKPGSVARSLLPLLQVAAPAPPPRPNINVRMTKAVISAPTGDAEVPLKFTAGLVLGVPLDAEIFNLATANLLRVKVKYPDQQTQLIVPKRQDLRPLLFEASPMETPNVSAISTFIDSGDFDVNIAQRKQSTESKIFSSTENVYTAYRLLTTVLFSHQVWSEACTVDVSLALDLTESEGSFTTSSSRKVGPSKGGSEYVIDLCKSVKVFVSPKAVKRGI